MGEYVLVTKWGDRDVCDPWSIGFISEFGEDIKGKFYHVNGEGTYAHYAFRHVWRVKEGEQKLQQYFNHKETL